MGMVCGARQLLRGGMSDTGYITYGLTYGSNIKTCLGHRFIYECFNGILGDIQVIDHLDQNRLNNALWSLEAMDTHPHGIKSASQEQTTPGIKLKKPVVATRHAANGSAEEQKRLETPGLAAAFANRRSPTTIVKVGHITSMKHGTGIVSCASKQACDVVPCCKPAVTVEHHLHGRK